MHLSRVCQVNCVGGGGGNEEGEERRGNGWREKEGWGRGSMHIYYERALIYRSGQG